MGYLGKKIKAAQNASGDSGWTVLKVGRGGNRCKGCHKEWSKMSKGDVIAHAECQDSDGCPHTRD